MPEVLNIWVVALF